jgi:hypothetical protein
MFNKANNEKVEYLQAIADAIARILNTFAKCGQIKNMEPCLIVFPRYCNFLDANCKNLYMMLEHIEYLGGAKECIIIEVEKYDLRKELR